MNNPQLADKVITAMIEFWGTDSATIAQKINEPHNIVKDMMEYLHSAYHGLFESGKGSGNSVNIFIRPVSIGIMKSLMERGGFTAQEAEKASEKHLNNYKRDLEINTLEESNRRSKRAELISIISIIIAAIVAIIEIGRSVGWLK